MSLPAEDTVMAAIGFGQHFNWHNGSGGCGFTRREAARRLPDALRASDACAAPDPKLTRLVAEVAEYGEDSEYVLTRTWQCAAEVIRAHMEKKANGWANHNPAWGRYRNSLVERYYPAAFDVVGVYGLVKSGPDGWDAA